MDDDAQEVEKESAVSKKLSEMTTRRVIMLVLLIMLALPFFQPTLWKDKMPSSAQYGINVLYRRFTDDMARFEPWANASASSVYLQSMARSVYVSDFFAYIYYHNPLCDSVPSAVSTPQDVLSTLFWVGATGDSSDGAQFFLPRFHGQSVQQLNERYNGAEWFFYQCNLSSSVVSNLNVPWNQTESCLSDSVRGVPLTRDGEHKRCPEELRYQERSVVFPNQLTDEEWDRLNFLFVFDRRRGSRLEALLNTFQTLFICFLLGFGAMTFSRDANTLVLTPIERMITKLNRIRRAPTGVGTGATAESLCLRGFSPWSRGASLSLSLRRRPRVDAAASSVRRPTRANSLSATSGRLLKARSHHRRTQCPRQQRQQPRYRRQRRRRHRSRPACRSGDLPDCVATTTLTTFTTASATTTTVYGTLGASSDARDVWRPWRPRAGDLGCP